MIDGRASAEVRPSLVVVKTIDDLGKLAEHHDEVIAHEAASERHWYRVDIGDTTYGYSFRVAAANARGVNPRLSFARVVPR